MVARLFGSQQSFLTETAIFIVEQKRKVTGYRFVPETECNHAQESHYMSIIFSDISAGPTTTTTLLFFVQKYKSWMVCLANSWKAGKMKNSSPTNSRSTVDHN